VGSIKSESKLTASHLRAYEFMKQKKRNADKTESGVPKRMTKDMERASIACERAQ
jgi:hypothetical protein